jgi:outer membrane protein assembly factor BamB
MQWQIAHDRAATWIDSAEGMVLIADAEGTLLGMSLCDGTVRWRRAGNPWRWLALAGRNLIGLRAGGGLSSLHAATGRRIWSVEVDTGLRLLGVKGEALYCLDPQNAELLRIDLAAGQVRTIGRRVVGLPALGSRYIIFKRTWVVGAEEITWLRGARVSHTCLKLFSVAPRLRFDVDCTLAVFGDYAFLIAPGEITALGLLKGEMRWVRPSRMDSVLLGVSTGVVFLAEGNAVVALSAQTGLTVWEMETSAPARNVLVSIDDQAVYLADGDVVHRINTR